eukprot:808118-Pyramimonas_sp.AAC.1
MSSCPASTSRRAPSSIKSPVCAAPSGGASPAIAAPRRPTSPGNIEAQVRGQKPPDVDSAFSAGG